MSEENKIAPPLRFPEFEKDWTIENLGSLAENLSNRRIPITSNKREKGDIPYYGATGVIDYVKDFIFDEELLLISEDGANLLDRNYPIAYSISGKTWVNNHAHVLKFENKSTEILVQKYINSKSIEEYLTGKAQPKLNRKNLERIVVPIAKNPKEQQKIANCLSSLDDVINAENEKLDLLKDHKKGLLQQLFPAEGDVTLSGVEGQPKFRFPEFKNDGDWQVKEIGELFKFKQGVQVPIKNQHPIKEDGMVTFIRIIDITKNSEPPRYINNPGEDHIITKDDLFMIRYGTPGAISIGYVGVIANNLFRLIWKSSDSLNSLFWFYAFQKIEKKIFSLSGSSSMPAISFSTLDNLDITYPKDPKEQQKIANCLSAADDLIAAQEHKIVFLQEHKKGLLQQLFPTINELAV